MFLATFVGAKKAEQRIKQKKAKKEEAKYIEEDDDRDSNEKRLSMEGELKASRMILERYTNPTINSSKLIPKEILKNAQGIILLTVFKGGILIGLNAGFGCIIIRNKSNNNGWSQPISIGINTISRGMFDGGSFNSMDYLLVLNDDKEVNEFINHRQITLNLNHGPIGRDTSDFTIYGQKPSIYSYGGLKLNHKKITIIKYKLRKIKIINN
eukprot:55555_1